MTKKYRTIKELTLVCDRCKKKETFQVTDKEPRCNKSKDFNLECDLSFSFNGYDNMHEQHGSSTSTYDLCNDCGREFNEKWIKMK